jgi:alcohol dehydrogenase (cytochrome c)
MYRRSLTDRVGSSTSLRTRNQTVKVELHMIMRMFLFLALSATALAQGPQNTEAREIGAPNVSFERILNPDQEPQNWLTYNGSNTSQRHSQLTQITPDNVGDLEMKWVFQSRSLELHEVTPLVVDGIMYTIESPNNVYALDAVTGETLWRYLHDPGEEAHNCCGRLSRGLAILGNTIFLATLDARIIAIDAQTGDEVWKTEPAGDPALGYAFTHAPLVVKDKVIAGTAGGEFGVRGWIAAWDVNTGEEVWRFYTVPSPDEPGGDTWSGDSWMHGGAPIWVTGSYDPEANLTYWGTGNPGPDWDGRARLGDNLYSASVIALNPDTGELEWYYQFSPHNEFDWDATQTPVLVDMDWEGTPRKLMLFANRNGVFYVLDRVTGEFLQGRSFVRTNWVDGFDDNGRPNQVANTSLEGTLIYPGNQGGTNWYPPSFSPSTGLFYVPTWENSSTTYILGEEPPEFGDGRTFAGEFPMAGAPDEDVYSSVRALDPATGEQVWEYRQAEARTEAGVMTTASDVLFSGGRDGIFYALNAGTGELLWESRLGSSVEAGPMTYAVDGNQYVTIMVGRALFTFGLPE